MGFSTRLNCREPHRLRGWSMLSLAAFVIGVHAGEPTAPAPAAGKDYTISDLKLEMLWVRPGTFLMGSPPDEEGRHQAEGPQTRVTLTQGYWLAHTEMTQAQYRALTGTNPSRFTDAGP